MSSDQTYYSIYYLLSIHKLFKEKSTVVKIETLSPPIEQGNIVTHFNARNNEIMHQEEFPQIDTNIEQITQNHQMSFYTEQKAQEKDVTIANLRQITQENECDTQSVILPPPKNQRKALQELENNGNCIKKYKLNEYKSTSDNIWRLNSQCLFCLVRIHDNSIRIMTNYWIHIVRQVLIFLLFVVDGFLFALYIPFSGDITIPLFLCLFLCLYTATQNLYYGYLKKICNFGDCCHSSNEATVFFTVLYCFMSILLFVILIMSINSGLNSEDFYLYRLGFIQLVITIALYICDTTIILESFAILGILCFLFWSVVYLIYVILRVSFYIICLEWIWENDDAEANRKEIIEKLTKDITVSYSTGVNSKVCTIDLRKFVENDAVVILDCSSSHVFHSECAIEWLINSNTCPICRSAPFPDKAYL